MTAADESGIKAAVERAIALLAAAFFVGGEMLRIESGVAVAQVVIHCSQCRDKTGHEVRLELLDMNSGGYDTALTILFRITRICSVCNIMSEAYVRDISLISWREVMR